MSNKYKLVFSIRFLGYFLFFVGCFGVVFILGPLLQVEFGYKLDRAMGVKRVVAETPAIVPTPEPISSPAPGVQPSVQPTPQPTPSQPGFESVSSSEQVIQPVSTQYGIVIEKINANAKIIPNVNPAKESEYAAALKDGVAEALGSTPPGQPGNLYLFSHSTDAPWNIIRFNAIFFLLRELETGDRVIIFHDNKRYDYIVFDKIIARANDVSYLTNRYEIPVLTLQTCDPPGTLLNRLIIRAKLVSS